MSKDKKAYLDYLFYDIGKQRYNFFLSSLYREDKGDFSSKWVQYFEAVSILDSHGQCPQITNYNGERKRIEYFFKRINQRQVLPNEVVIDLEERKTIPNVVKRLMAKDYIFKVFDTGSRGFHIHMFFNKSLTEQQKLKIIREYGGDPQIAGKKHMINLEYAPHWKSKKIKSEVSLKFILSKSFK